MKLLSTKGTGRAESHIILKNESYVPILRTNMISCRLLFKDGNSSTFEEKTSQFRKENLEALNGNLMDDVISLNGDAGIHTISAMEAIVENIELWYD